MNSHTCKDHFVFMMAAGATLVALAPWTLVAQAGPGSSAAADTLSAQRTAAVMTQTISQPITLCIVPGSGTAYRVGGPGLPTQCLAPTHTPLSLNLTGPQGLQGLTGAKGDSGPIGPKGETGEMGPAGPKGETGEVGPQGVVGLQGAVGPQGAFGPQGAAGPQGETGLTGQAGAAGEPGPMGPIGERGAVGPIGETGPVGPAGPTGAPGEAGAAGATGAAGADGSPGAQGPQGVQGEAGAPGTTDHSALTNLNTDSHPQYLLAGPRTALDGFSVSGTMYLGALPPSGAGSRLVWNPRKAAFRAGAVNSNEWDDEQMGFWSTAFGNNSWAPGNGSLAGGMNSRAGGSESFAMGIGSDAQGRGSVAFSGSAWGEHAFAVGVGSTADGTAAIAIGAGAEAVGPHATAIGHGKASGSRSVSIGTGNNIDGEQSIIIGNGASSEYAGSVVISAQLSNASRVYATAANQFVARAVGGTVFWTNDQMDMGVELLPGSGSWSMISDRNKKTAFSDVDGESLLRKLRSVPVSSWTYKAQDRSVRHIGPMAQDWQRAFALSTDSTTINSGDIAGVTLAGVQALEARTSRASQRLVSHEQRIGELELQVQQLLQELRALREVGRRE